MPQLGRRLTAVTAALAMSMTTGAMTSPASADSGQDPDTKKSPVATGYGGAVSTVDVDASAAAIKVLRDGGNAVDAAVAAAATLGVTEPYSAGIGGGGYFVYYDAEKEKVSTIDGRETAPAAMPKDAFIDPASPADKPVAYPFRKQATSGMSVGVPGTPATWERALDRWGTMNLAEALEPAIDVAEDGFVVDETFRLQTAENQDRFAPFAATRELFLPGGAPPAVGTVFTNPDLAETYRILGHKGVDEFYEGPLAEEIVSTVRNAPSSVDATVPVPGPAGVMTTEDLDDYKALDQKPTQVNYRGYDVYGMAPSSSGGTTVGEALNILEVFDLPDMKKDEPAVLHHYLEASALAFADRAKYVGDPAFVKVPTKDLLDPVFGKERACELNPLKAAEKPLKTAGDVKSYDGVCPVAPAALADEKDTENINTTNLTVSDKWGNVVEYTLTIEQTGGSGIVVPGRGFILNNELTDFSPVYSETDPNRIEPGKRPRSSMSPTIVLKDDEPFLALGSPGGSTIITTVLQTLINRIDLKMNIEHALAAPRAAQRNTTNVSAEQTFIDKYGKALTDRFGHTFAAAGEPGTSAAEIGAATAIEFSDDGKKVTAVAEPARRGGGSAMVVKPSPPK
jgi:gamma-glutamyltranspeptidase / glutathione hydrolase